MFDWNNKQNGALIGSIGIVSALLQGGYVRRAMSKTGEGKMARRGAGACAAGLVLLALVPLAIPSSLTLAVALLRAASVCMAFTSATVVNALTAYASLQCDGGVDADTGKAREEHPELAKGRALGRFRSSGQLGRAIGPLLGEFAWRARPRVYDGADVVLFQRVYRTGRLVLRSRMPSVLEQWWCYRQP